MSSFGHTASGLLCSHGSKLDECVPRAKLPKRALPPSIRSQLKLAPVIGHDIDESYDALKNAWEFWSPGQGVVMQRGAYTNSYSAGNQKHFLKRGSGIGKQTDIWRCSESHAFINRHRGNVSAEPERGFVRDKKDWNIAWRGGMRVGSSSSIQGSITRPDTTAYDSILINDVSSKNGTNSSRPGGGGSTLGHRGNRAIGVGL